jgi:hypothetical protein
VHDEQRERFGAYNSKFDAQVGTVEVGQYGRWSQTLVQRLGAEEFEARWQAFKDLEDKYREILRDGGTVTNALYDEVREQATHLLLKEADGSFWW